MKQVRWKLEKSTKAPKAGALTPEEQECVRVALRVLRVRFGTFVKVAQAMGTRERNVTKWASPKGRPGAGVALAVARLAGVRVDAVLTGTFPEPGACPLCGRTGT
jgi:hypothetical protein